MSTLTALRPLRLVRRRSEEVQGTTMRDLTFGAALLASATAMPVAAQMGMPKPLPPDALAEAVEPAKVAYLEKARVASGPVKGPFAFHFAPDFYRSTLFLVGESHGSDAPHVFDAALFAHLVKRVGVRDYLAEADPIQAAHLNAYLESGDEAELDIVLGGWATSGAQWGSNSYANKIRAIRALNSGLGKRPVLIHGVDRIQDFDVAAVWLRAHGGTVDTAALAAAAKRRDKAKVLRAGVPLGNDATLEALRVVLDAEIAGQTREAVIATSYSALRAGLLKSRPAYGMWGLFHVLQGGMDKATPAATLIRAANPTERIASIVLVPIGSKALMYVPTGSDKTTPINLDLFNVDGPLSKMAGSSDLAAAAPAGRITIYDLDRAGSPYRIGNDFAVVKTSIGQDFVPKDPNLPSVRYARYVGVVRGSDWSPPYMKMDIKR